MAFSSMTSIGLMAVAMGSAAVGSLWSDQKAMDAQSAERQLPHSACLAMKYTGEPGALPAPSADDAGCQAAFQAYSAHASWDALSRAVGR
jgi:hypothetical protein